MELNKVLKERRSIRKYLNKPVEKEKIYELIEFANYAPSWKNSQVSRYYVIDKEDRKEDFVEKCLYNFNKKNVINAPVIIVCTVVDKIIGIKEGKYETHLKDGYQYLDNGLQIENLCLKAFDLGLGTLIMGLYDENETRKFLKIPDNEKITVLISVGYTDFSPNMPSRKSLDEILKFDN